LLIPVYSSYDAGRLKAHILTLPRAARYSGCKTIVLEMPRSSAPAIIETLGPVVYKDLEVKIRYRDFDEGFTFWPVPPPLDLEPQAREVKTYRQPARKPVTKQATKPEPPPQEADEDPFEDPAFAGEEPEFEGKESESVEEGSAFAKPGPTSAKPGSASAKPSRPAAEQARPQALDYKSLKLNPQQPIPSDDQDLMGGVKVTRVTKKPKA